MKKRAQVTVFIIISILIIVAIALTFFVREEVMEYFFEQKIQEQIAFDLEVRKIYSFVEDCIEKSGYDVLYGIGQHGGFFIPSRLSTDSGIAYYFIKDKSYMPLKERIEEEISYYIGDEIFLCVKNFMDFPSFSVKQGEIKTKAEINDEEILLNIEYPLSISKGETVFQLKEFRDIKIPIRLGIVYNAVSEIIQEQLENPDSICLSCLINLGIENDLNIDMIYYDENTIIFTIRDEKSIINNKSYEFKFAIEHG